MQKALLYLRYSSAGQKGTSIDDQREECRRYAEKNGWTIQEEFTDRAKSAWKGKERAGLNQLLGRIDEDQNINLVLVYDMDRLSRDYISGYTDIIKLHEKGVKVADTKKGIYSQDTLVGALTTVLSLYQSQEYSDKLSHRVSTSHRRQNQAGYWTTTAPFGYKIKRVPGGATIEPDPAQAEIVNEIFKMAKAGTPTTKIAHTLNQAGRGAPRGGVWRACTVFVMLNNPVYAGYFPRGRGSRKLVKSGHKPLIRRAMWHDVSSRFPAEGKARRPRKHPLSGLIFCGECSSRFTISSGPGRLGHPAESQYRCHGRLSNPDACPNARGMPEWYLFHLSMTALESIAQNIAPGEDPLPANLDDLNDRHTLLIQQQKRLIEALADGSAPPAIIDKIREIEEQAGGVLAEIATAEAGPGPSLATGIEKMLKSGVPSNAFRLLCDRIEIPASEKKAVVFSGTGGKYRVREKPPGEIGHIKTPLLELIRQGG